MDQHETGIPVLARFPDLDEAAHGAATGKPSGLALLASSGRIIGQNVSVKLLAGTALFLLVGAVLPFCIGRNSTPADSFPAGSSQATSQSKLAKDKPEAIPADDEAAALIAGRPAVRVIASKEPSSAPAVLPPASDANGKPGAIATTEPPESSRWRGAGPEAIRPAEYQADVRGNATPWKEPETRR
jgi:hypothetical protein